MMRFHSTVLTILLVWLIFCPTKAQHERPTVPPEDYTKWHTLWLGASSPDGRHFFSNLSVNNTSKTLQITTLASGHVRKIDGAQNYHFLPVKDRILYQINDSIKIEHVSGQLIKAYTNFKQAKVLQAGRYLVLGDKQFYQDTAKTITVVDLTKLVEHTFTQVYTLAEDPTERRIALRTAAGAHQSVTVFDLDRWQSQQFSLAMGFRPTVINWSGDGLSFVALKATDPQAAQTPQMGYVADVTKSGEVLPLNLSQVFVRPGMQLSSYTRIFPKLSADKKRVLISVNEPKPTKDTARVEVWRTHATRIYPYLHDGDPELGPKLYSLNVHTGAAYAITAKAEEDSKLSPNGDYAFTYNHSAYKPSYRFGGEFTTVTVTDIVRQQQFVLQEKYKRDQAVLFTPDSKAILYRDGNTWQKVNLETRERTVLTSAIDGMLSTCSNCYSGIAAGTDRRSFYLFDRYDLWSVNEDGTHAVKLTHGAANGTEFRFAGSIYDRSKLNSELLTVDPQNGIFLEAHNRSTGETGYYKWSERGGLESIAYKSRKIDWLRQLPNNNGYLYLERAFDVSPQIVWVPGLKTKNEKVVGISNPHQQEYAWGRAEMVHYYTPPGYRPTFSRPLHGALFYPANYQPGKKYPLIVYIYEDTSDKLHEYQTPGYYKFVDFHQTDFSQRGYFVLCPQLTPRQPGNPGHSAVENLQAAVDYMKSTGMIDESAIGLYGHSFGGYESLFAATQLPDFATVVAGAAITDMVSNYFSHRPLLSGPVFRRTEHAQTDMKRSYYDIPELYQANSPVHHANRITAPILLWTGKEDRNVESSQSVEFYLAMLRLDKTCTLLVYPGEDHVLNKPENQADLYARLFDWYGHYLKGEEIKPWMMPADNSIVSGVKP